MFGKLLVLRSDDQHLIADTRVRHFRAVVPQRLSLGPIAFGLRHGYRRSSSASVTMRSWPSRSERTRYW